MKIQNYVIPPECKHVSVEAEGNKVVITFEPENPNVFFCPATDYLEESPNIGHLSILWNGNHKEAIIAYVADTDLKEDSYQAKNGEWYSNAIRFRSEEQYLKVLKFNVTENKT